ncbi:ATP-dependent Clp protease adaptor ClpS [Mariniphaga sediminis]|jgi:ATP-dependent Clp protease adaptor protein ClpS|uniref:ATP-dependent Clp protease adaptor ClpS n=1 Tax=Mariniphaga sediminis TaxID=1628158 RepID=A0A399CY44_9BACT|nr:ATP-dependent Clp protease adaptor ClpS [Mariniphaga sediminis]RIH64349.1 ATP-dependent Clp protease adaptor ClpS [Mariniphaga sediminis]
MTSRETKKKPLKEKQKEVCGNYALILHNDDVHSFDYVIDALIDICDHDYEQAVQCTLITHHKGSCDIRKGKFEILKQMKDALFQRELSTTIDLQP